MTNVATTTKETPDDLMSFKDICLKHGYDYSYLYKWAVLKGAINVYSRGTWNLSEREVLDFSKSISENRLKELRVNKKGDVQWRV